MDYIELGLCRSPSRNVSQLHRWYIPKIGNGLCYAENSNERCDYDRGDCYECTCYNGLAYDCEGYDFFCRGPNSDCVDPRVEMYANCTDGDIPGLGNGWCDAVNNNERYGYDGGNCCEGTCINGLAYDSGEGDFFSRDPNLGCVDPQVEMYLNCTDDYVSEMRNWQCDVDNNNQECD